MSGIRRAILLSTGERYFVLLANFATVAAVSRILTPAEIGVSVIGTAIVGVALAMREFASASFLIQRAELSRDDVRGAFAVMLVLTLATAAVITLLAPRLAAAYGEPALVPYFRVICACLVLDLVYLQVVSMLRRDMAFGKLALVNIALAATGAATTVALALLGFSFMSFAWAWLAGSAVAGALALALRPDFWMFRPSFRDWRGMAAFGGYNGGTALIYKVFDQVPYLLLGRLVSMDAAALFSRSLLICQLPDRLLLGGALSVALPAFAAHARQGQSLKAPYLKSIGLVTALAWPAHVVLAVLAYPLVDIVLGQQWHGVAPLVQVVAVASLFAFSIELNYPVLVTAGAIRDVFLRALISFPASAAILTIAALLGGLQATAWSMMLVVPFNAAVSLYFVRRRIGVTLVRAGGGDVAERGRRRHRGSGAALRGGGRGWLRARPRPRRPCRLPRGGRLAGRLAADPPRPARRAGAGRAGAQARPAVLTGGGRPKPARPRARERA